MDELRQDDVPRGNDWDCVAEAAAWADEADRIRPWRPLKRGDIGQMSSAQASRPAVW